MKLICINLTDQIDPYVDIPLTDQSPQQSSPTCNTFTITQASPLSTMKNHTKERNEQKKHGGVKEKSTGTSLKKKKIDTKMGMLRELRRQDGEFKIFEL